MDGNVVLVAMLLILVVPGDSAASSGVNLRVLMAEGKGDDKASSQKVSPSPTPDPSPKVDPLVSNQKPPPKPDPPPINDDKSNKTTDKIPPESGNSPLVPPPPSGPESKDPQGPKNGEHGRKDKDPKGSNNPTGSGSPTNTKEAICGASLEKCQYADLVACLQRPGDESKELFLLVHNGGENALTVNITVPTSMHIDVKDVHLAKHRAKKIQVSKMADDGTKIILNAGKGDCIIHIRPTFHDWNPLPQFLAYAGRLTPVYGAYFFFLTMVIAGGTWACCKFGRRARRGGAGVPYQQLEMGALPQSSSTAVDASPADGWDQGWDDDWDEEAAAAEVVRPSEKHPAGNVSSNGLTLRSPNKDGWDVDWDE